MSASLIALCLDPNNCEKHDDVFHTNFAFSTLVVDDDDDDDSNNNDDNATEFLFSDDDDICVSFGSADDDEMGHTRSFTTNKGPDDMVA